jgi:uncharacterized protein
MLVLLAVAALTATAGAARALDVPPLTQRVTDLAELLPRAQRDALERRLAAYEQRTTQQFAVLTLPSLEGEPVEDFSMRVVEKWKLGKAKEDNGLLLLVVPKDRKMRIEVGYGLEGKITDALSARIMRQVLRPAFRSGDFATGIDTAVTALMQAGSGETVDALPPEAPQDDGHISPFMLLLLVALIFIGPRFLFPFLLGSAWGGGGFGGGGGGGGGFSGGGGSFGGGGASGDW